MEDRCDDFWRQSCRDWNVRRDQPAGSGRIQYGQLISRYDLRVACELRDIARNADNSVVEVSIEERCLYTVPLLYSARVKFGFLFFPTKKPGDSEQRRVKSCCHRERDIQSCKQPLWAYTEKNQQIQDGYA